MLGDMTINIYKCLKLNTSHALIGCHSDSQNMNAVFLQQNSYLSYSVLSICIVLYNVKFKYGRLLVKVAIDINEAKCLLSMST